MEDRKVDEVKEAKNKAPTGPNETTKKDVKTAPYWFEDGNPSFHLKNVESVANNILNRYGIQQFRLLRVAGRADPQGA